jgi:hypothetical protein
MNRSDQSWTNGHSSLHFGKNGAQNTGRPHQLPPVFVSGNVSHHETIGRPANTSTPFGQHALSQDNQYRQNYSTHTRFGEDSGLDSDILLYITVGRRATSMAVVLSRLKAT